MANYTSPYDIGVGDVVNYNGTQYTVLTNYIKGETDAQGHTPRENRTILIDAEDNRTMCQDFNLLEIISQWQQKREIYEVRNIFQ